MYPTPVVTATGLKKWAWNGREAIFLSERLEINSSGDLDYVEILGDIWTDINITNLYQEGGVDFKNGKKQEELIRRFIEMSAKEGGVFGDMEEARSEFFSYIEGYYNRVRLHSGIDYKSPMEYELELKTKYGGFKRQFLV